MYQGLQEIQQSEATAARRTVYIALRQSGDHVSPYATALSSKTLLLSMNGDTPAASSNYAAAVDTTSLPGLYSLELTATEVATVGILAVSGKIAGISCEGGALVRIVGHDPFEPLPDMADAVKDAGAKPWTRP